MAFSRRRLDRAVLTIANELPAIRYSLPLERYVLSRWRSSPEQDLDVRRRRLAREFVDTGQSERMKFLLNPQESDLPPRDEWEEILSSLRSPSQRALARPSVLGHKNVPGNFGVIWLRTHYEDSEDAHRALLETLNVDTGLDTEDNVLDDKSLYAAYEGDWSGIFEILPERLFGLHPDLKRNSLDGALMYNENLLSRERKFPADLHEAELENALAEFHHDAIINYMFIADKTAMDTGEILVVFFDDCGRVVRSHRELPQYPEGLAGAWFDGFYDEMGTFREADIGVDYQFGGPYGPIIKE